MFERFTGRARQVVVLAQGEARLLQHNYIGTEHILLGLIREEEGLAARVLDSIDISLDRTRPRVVELVGRGDEVSPSALPFTPRAEKVLRQGEQDADALGEDLVATHHLLLGQLRENDGVANRVLLDLGADPEHLRGLVLADLEDAPKERHTPPKTLTRISRSTGRVASPSPTGPTPAEVCSFCGEKGSHMFAGFPPKADEVSICDLCLEVFYDAAGDLRYGSGSP